MDLADPDPDSSEVAALAKTYEIQVVNNQIYAKTRNYVSKEGTIISAKYSDFEGISKNAHDNSRCSPAWSWIYEPPPSSVEVRSHLSQLEEVSEETSIKMYSVPQNLSPS